MMRVELTEPLQARIEPNPLSCITKCLIGLLGRDANNI